MIQRTTQPIVSRPPITDSSQNVVSPISSERDAERREHRQDRLPGEVDLLADGRGLGLERRHETYTAAITNVMPNTNMQIAADDQAGADVLAREPAGQHRLRESYRWASATIALNSSARYASE